MPVPVNAVHDPDAAVQWVNNFPPHVLAHAGTAEGSYRLERGGVKVASVYQDVFRPEKTPTAVLSNRGTRRVIGKRPRPMGPRAPWVVALVQRQRPRVGGRASTVRVPLKGDHNTSADAMRAAEAALGIDHRETH